METEIISTSNLKRRLMFLPAQIVAAKGEARQKLSRLQDMQQTISEIEAEVFVAVSEEELPTGKPRFSNEAARKAECTRRLSFNKDYSQARVYLSQEAGKHAVAEDQVMKLEQEFIAYQHVAKITAAELMIMAGTNTGIKTKEGNPIE